MLRKNLLRTLCALLLLSSCKFSYAVKSLKLDISKDQPIVIEVPTDLWKVKELSASEGIPISVLQVDGDFIKNKRWEDGKLLLLVEFHLDKAQDCGSGVMSGRIIGCPPNWKQVELRSTKAWLKLQFPPDIDVDNALKQVSFLGTVAQFEATDYLHDTVFLPNQEKQFAALPQLDLETRYSLFKMGIAGGFDVFSISFKGLSYVSIVISDTPTFNTINVSQDQRIAQVIKETILPRAKMLLPIVEGKPVGGLAFSAPISAYNFVTNDESKLDSLDIYMSLDELDKFSTSDITSQKLVDDSFVLVNGDRVEAKL